MRDRKTNLLPDPRTRRLAAGLAAVLVLALLAGVVGAQSSNKYGLWWYTMDNGNRPITGAQYGLAGTLGESLAGQASGQVYAMAHGYDPELVEQTYHYVYLPIVLRAHP
jgi:hypothetical protein